MTTELDVTQIKDLIPLINSADVADFDLCINILKNAGIEDKDINNFVHGFLDRHRFYSTYNSDERQIIREKIIYGTTGSSGSSGAPGTSGTHGTMGTSGV